MKVHIIGKGFGWELAPEDGETWGVNDLILYRDAKKVFDMHDHTNGFNNTLMQAVAKKVNALKIPFISLKKYPEIPTSIAYPIDEIIDAFGTDYFTNGIDYMTAYAIYTGADEINLYGVNVMSGSAYAFERPGVCFWVGYAKGRGIQVNIFGKWSTIMRSRDGELYGYKREQASLNIVEKAGGG